MARFRVTVAAELVTGEPVDAARLRIVARAKVVKLLAPSMVKVVLIRRGDDAKSAADLAIADLQRALPPGTRFRRPPTWLARERRLVSGAPVRGRWEGGGPDEDDDGLGGVREPHRPLPPSGSASLALDDPSS